MPDIKINYAFKFSLTSQIISFDDGYRNAIPGPGSQQVALDDFLPYILSGERESFKAFLAGDDRQAGSQIVVTMTDNPESEKDGAQCSALFKQTSEVKDEEFAGVIINLSTVLPGELLFKDLEKFVVGISQIREITHDLNNQFQIITGFGSALQEDATTPDMRESADNVVNAVTKAIGYNHKLRSFFPPKLRKPLYLPTNANTSNMPGAENVTDYNATAKTNTVLEQEADSHNTTDKMTIKNHPNKTIMVVDDEPLVRKFLCEMLKKRLGHNVVGFSTADEAILANNDAATPYALAIIDMNLPDTSADDLFSNLISARPALKVILISGDSHGGLADRLIAKGACGFLQKPATVKSLAEAVNRAFSGVNEAYRQANQ